MVDFNTPPHLVRKIGDLKRMADYWFRQYKLQTTPLEKGKYRCPLKGRLYPVDKMHVCHYIDRAKMITRYDDENCILCSESSNVWDAQIPDDEYKSKHHKDFAEHLGEATVEELEALAHERLIYLRDDYIDLINKIKSQIDGTKDS